VKVLVTGSSGRVGSAIARALQPTHDVIGLDVAAHTCTTDIGSIEDVTLVDRLVGAVDAVIHTASLHAPHVGNRSDAAFRVVNVDGTRRLLDAALRNRLAAFVYTSTTSAYGAAMVNDARAVWVTEELTPRARDIYDETKLAAEALCADAHRAGLPSVSLRISRCFTEPADVTAIYRLYRGIDVRDVADAHERALTTRFAAFEVFNISARSPFVEADVAELKRDAASVIARYFPDAPSEFAARGWRLPQTIDRVYVTDKAREKLGFVAVHDFAALLRQSSV
jgi:UDP-glucose 4-epimerase